MNPVALNIIKVINTVIIVAVVVWICRPQFNDK